MRALLDQSSAVPRSKWWHRLVSPPACVPRVWCFPCVGSGTAIWLPLARQLAADADLLAVCAPGRDARLNEAPCANLDELADLIASELAPVADARDVFLGHGMGALLAFEVAQRRRAAGRGELRGLVACSSHPPHHRWSAPQLHRLPPRDFLAGVERHYGPVPPELRAEPEFLEHLLPALRADLEAVETYRPRNHEPLGCPILAISGTADPLVPSAAMLGWKVHTTAACEICRIPAGHFVLTESSPLVAHTVRHFLARIP